MKDSIKALSWSEYVDKFGIEDLIKVLKKKLLNMDKELEVFEQHSNFPWLKNRTILLVKHGSHAYGTNIDGSDEDVKGVCIAPLENRIGLIKTFEQVQAASPVDHIIYTTRKNSFSYVPKIIQIFVKFCGSINLIFCTIRPLAKSLFLFVTKCLVREFNGPLEDLLLTDLKN